MPRFRWIALQGNSRGLLPPLLLFGFLITISGIPAHAADEQAACRSPFARIVSIQGSIELQRARQNDWSRVTRLDTPLCEGDKLRTGARSRAALFIQPETLVRVDQNTRIAVNQTAEETLVEFTQEDIVATSTDAHTCGAGYFITRFPRKFRVNTPHLNAAVEGTEFLVAMRCEATELSVFEGKVLAASAGANIFPSQSVVSGQTLTVGGTEPPAIKLNLKPADAVQWTLYYPPITPAGTAPVEDCSVVAQDNRVSCLIARAEQRLRAGRVEEARANINDALAIAPFSSDAKALSSIISLVRNDKAEALRVANEAVAATANSAPAWLALSYAQQADFKLEAALTSAQRASELTPSSALAFARVAELQLSLGWTREAEKTAKQAVAANPSESRAHMILGFVHLAQIKVKEAREDFEHAIELDSTEPLSRLGLGLAIIRKGSMVEGREQIEIAVALDPTNSLIRSYVGKAYYEENTKERDQLASSQFGLAKGLDPNDPTPWFYESILRQTQNRPVDALDELQTSIEKNDARAVYRSRLLLDNDVAARIASRAGLFGELGFERLAILESATALSENPANSSAHLLLAAAYANLPRHDIARVSETLQALIRQPVSVPPVVPQLATNNLAILRETGPSEAGVNEFSPLFNRNQSRIQIDGIAGSRGTQGDQFVLSGLSDSFAYAVSQLHYETEGFVENDAAEKNAYGLFLNTQVSPDATFQMDARISDFEIGQTFFRFDPIFALPTSIRENSSSLRINSHYVSGPDTDWIFSTAIEDRERVDTYVPLDLVLTQTDVTTIAAEIQILKRIGNLWLTSGIGYVSERNQFPLEQSNLFTTATNLYASGQWQVPQLRLSINAGFSFDDLTLTNSFFANDIQRTRVNPKLGIVWSPISGTTLRAAAFSSVKRPFIGGQTIEPTQVVGFNQFFNGFETLYGDRDGTISRRVGVAVDQVLSPTALAGLEITSRKLRVPSLIEARDFDWKEKTANAYLYKTIPSEVSNNYLSGWNAATSIEYEYEKIQRPQILTSSEGIVEVTTTRVPIGVIAFKGTYAIKLAVSHVKQSGIFSVDQFLPQFQKEDQAWITDVSIQYSLPRRRGRLVFGAMNLFDNSIDLFETDPFNPRIATRRFVFGKINLTF